MFGKSVNLFRFFGFQIKVDISWVIIAVLVTWSLSVGFFPYFVEGLSPGTYWILGVVGALGLFFSILFHEFCHSWVARNHGMSIQGITLFIFGGVAEMEDEPQSARSEFLIAVAGPLASLFLGAVFLSLLQAVQYLDLSTAVLTLFMYLAMINFLLAAFNLIPAYPMDGGRILKSVLWHWKQDPIWATRVAANMGSVFGLLLIAAGLLQILAGNVVNGIWYFVIGMFIRFVAQNAFRQQMVRRLLSGIKVRSLMKTPVHVPARISLSQFLQDYVYQHHHQMYPVLDGERLVGSITTSQVRNIERSQWPVTLVRDVLSPISDENTLDPETDIVDALNIMNDQGQSKMMVVRNGILLGVISMKDIMGYMSHRMEFEGEDSFFLRKTRKS